MTLQVRRPAPDEIAPTTDGIEVGEAESPRVAMLQSMAKRVQNPGARKFIESQIKAERSNLAAVAKRSRDAAAAEELRGLANEALQAGDAATHSALTAQAEKLDAPAAAEAEATHARAAAQQVIDAGNAPGAGPLARAVGAGIERKSTRRNY